MKAVDMHCDTISVLYEKRKRGSEETLWRNSGHVDVERLLKGDILLQNFALFVDCGKTSDPFTEAEKMAALYYGELCKCEKWIAPVYSWQDIEKNRKEGKISALLTVEEGAVCRGSAACIRKLYEWGVRMMTLTWNYPNAIGWPNLRADRISQADSGSNLLPPAPEQEAAHSPLSPVPEQELPFYLVPDREHGLTEKGIELLGEMERLGMIIDVSHLSDAGFYDVLTHTKKPFVASHSNARAVCPWVRNLTDDMLRKLGERGGVAGLNFCPDFLGAGNGTTVPEAFGAIGASGAGLTRRVSGATAESGAFDRQRASDASGEPHEFLPAGHTKETGKYQTGKNQIRKNQTEKNPGTVAAVVEHAKHMARVGGVDCVGLGSDFDGIGGHAQLKDCSYLPRLADALQKAGFSASEVEKIFCKNVLRIYRELL